MLKQSLMLHGKKLGTFQKRFRADSIREQNAHDGNRLFYMMSAEIMKYNYFINIILNDHIFILPKKNKNGWKSSKNKSAENMNANIIWVKVKEVFFRWKQINLELVANIVKLRLQTAVGINTSMFAV